LATSAGNLAEVDARVSVCRACPRLVSWREDVAVMKRRAFAGEPYWGRPIAGWGDPRAWLLVVGLAPAAHGGNRTGRIFTGDRSGDWISPRCHRAGLAAQSSSVAAGDGQGLVGVRIAAPRALRAAGQPPHAAGTGHLRALVRREVTLLAGNLRVLMALGGFAWEAMLAAARRLDWSRRGRPRFGHGAQPT
jgi:uracil-DNA glycosylase